MAHVTSEFVSISYPYSKTVIEMVGCFVLHILRPVQGLCMSACVWWGALAAAPGIFAISSCDTLFVFQRLGLVTSKTDRWETLTLYDTIFYIHDTIYVISNIWLHWPGVNYPNVGILANLTYMMCLESAGGFYPLNVSYSGQADQIYTFERRAHHECKCVYVRVSMELVHACKT